MAESNNDRNVALARLWEAAQALSIDMLEKLVVEAENRLKWEKALAVGRYMASTRTTKRRGPAALVNYDGDWMPFAERIGLSQGRATRFWGNLFAWGRRTAKRTEELKAAEISIQQLRKLRDTPYRLNDDDRELLEIWLLNL